MFVLLGLSEVSSLQGHPWWVLMLEVKEPAFLCLLNILFMSVEFLEEYILLRSAGFLEGSV